MTTQRERAEQLGEEIGGNPEALATALPELARIVAGPDDVETLVEAIDSLGQAWDDRAAAILLEQVPVDHPDEDVRLSLTMALPNGLVHGSVRDRVIDALVLLSADDSDEVRERACAGLGQLDADSEPVRAALAARLTDHDDDTRCAALVGLAKTGDVQALIALERRLSTDVLDEADAPGDPMIEHPDVVRLLELEAAAELAEPTLMPLLQALQAAWDGDADDHTKRLDFALRRCDPEAHRLAADFQAGFEHGVNRQLAGSGWSIEMVGSYPRTTLVVTQPDGTVSPVFGDDRYWQDLVPAAIDLTAAIRSWTAAELNASLVHHSRPSDN